MHYFHISESMLEADKLFDEVLARRDRADATRNALGVLQRFKFLFSLPVSIERNIRKGDYDVVINDYARAKNLFSNTDVAVSASLFYPLFILKKSLWPVGNIS